MEPRDSAPIIKIYQQAIIKTLSEAISTNVFPETLQIVQIFDRQSNRFQLLCHGWVDEERVWIQHNERDVDIGEELSNNGIPKSQIVLGLHRPSIRELNSTYASE
ncbi:hypothetical protein DSM106972_010860 [Dulcicalothrix desertica PCC 7102]|uniref:XisI protein n=1 Tax=Dulcicalothrix desertica PCC 7102 TaxID=232991 RepID=A0A433VSD0_9CYAN|nr:element excision factor XisI family protein [Dulcicalothrix desertica]RUT09033.1 hypothetical protein DSM106972_010860 [Dulcicalothrix desertica PCC 7102]TWH49908.1 XisI protein [Dulcicalothrix desertica PCC 7102]